LASAGYKAQPAIHRTRGAVPLAGNDHIYTVSKLIWPEEVENVIGSLLVGKTLHVCCGKSTLGDVRVDLYEDTADFQCDAADMSVLFEDKSFDTVLFDGPYNGRLEWLHKVCEELPRLARKRIIIQSWWLMANKHGRYRKAQSDFELSAIYTWAPSTYFGRANLIHVYDSIEHADDGSRSSHIIQPPSEVAAPTVDLRRDLGQYFTPPVYADLAHEYLATALGPQERDLYERNWWEPACGHGALTLPCPINMTGKVFISGLETEDLEKARAATPCDTQKFIFDFLNQRDDELPCDLLQELRDTKKWVILVNPPFTASTSIRGSRLSHITESMIAKQMGKVGMKLPAHTSTLQFMFRLLTIAQNFELDLLVGIFAQPAFLTHESFRPFRELWLKHFDYRGGFCVNGKEFETNGEWPLVFTTWRLKRFNLSGAADLAEVDVYANGKMIGQKRFAPTSQPLSAWVDRPVNVVPALPLTSAVKIATRDDLSFRGLPDKALGWAAFISNDLLHSKNCYLLSSVSSNGAGWGITSENFEQSLVCLAIRCLPIATWLNDRDCFSVPDTSGNGWTEWSRDAIVWLLASGGNHSSSLGPVDYQGATFEVPNEFFWMTPADILAMASMPEAIGLGAETAGSPHLALWLRNQTFSSDAAAILDYMRSATIETAGLRGQADPCYQLSRWDAGWYQIRHGLLWEKGAKRQSTRIVAGYREFKRAHARLRERLQQGLYEFGILPR
jgi:hypothetical protein